MRASRFFCVLSKLRGMAIYGTVKTTHPSPLHYGEVVLSVSMCLCLCLCIFISLCLGHCHHQTISFQKIYDLYGLEHHTVEINGDVTMQTDEQTSEDRATQSMDTVRLSFAIKAATQKDA